MLRDYKLVDNGSVIYNDDWSAYEVVIGDQSYLVKAEKKATDPMRVKDCGNGYEGTLIEYRGDRCIFQGDDGLVHNIKRSRSREV